MIVNIIIIINLRFDEEILFQLYVKPEFLRPPPQSHSSYVDYNFTIKKLLLTPRYVDLEILKYQALTQYQKKKEKKKEK